MLRLITYAVFVVTPLYIIYKPPACLIAYLARRWPDVLWRVETRDKIVALTIDDGPSEFTQEISDILLANNASATFFVIGSHIMGHEGTLPELITRQNELANHAGFDEPSRSLAITELIRQIHDVQRQIEAAYSTVGSTLPPKYFRPGSGLFTSQMRKTVNTLGYRMVLGNVFPFDPQIPYSRINACHILSMVGPGSIIICHDGRSWTAPMLRTVLPALTKRGYRVVTLTELLRREQA